MSDLDTRAVAVALGVKPKTVRKWIKGKKLQAWSLPGKRHTWRVSPAALAKLRESGGTPTVAPKRKRRQDLIEFF